MPHSNRAKPSGTYLTHLFGRGLEADRRFIVERFRALTNGEIRPMLAEAVELVSHAGIRAMRPARNEVIICTARDDSDSGVQLWGSLATGLFFPHGRKLLSPASADLPPRHPIRKDNRICPIPPPVFSATCATNSPRAGSQELPGLSRTGLSRGPHSQGSPLGAGSLRPLRHDTDATEQDRMHGLCRVPEKEIRQQNRCGVCSQSVLGAGQCGALRPLWQDRTGKGASVLRRLYRAVAATWQQEEGEAAGRRALRHLRCPACGSAVPALKRGGTTETLPVWSPTYTVYDCRTGDCLGTWESREDVALCLAFAKRGRDEVEIVTEAPLFAAYAGS